MRSPTRLPVVLFALAAGCHASPPDGPHTPESDLRASLGIPADAKRVIVFYQSSHLDIDWQKTFDDYYSAFVGEIFSDARTVLDAQPRAFYGVAEMAYLAHHTQAHPEDLSSLKSAAARGALHVVGGGMTSPDTMLPETELVMRDYLLGSAFAEDGFGLRARSAWLPDSFGHAATAPDLLAAAGFDSVGFARVDGAPTFLEAQEKRPIRPGSTAETLEKLGSADFLWTGSGGATIFAHYLSYNLYCTGDNLDYDESITFPGTHIGVYRGDETGYTDGKVDEYVGALEPYAKTPYMLVPVGCDFQQPKEQLLAYLDGYNQRRYPATGVWAVAAPFDDYVALVMAHKDDLPTLSGEISPYFMGFYGTRAGIKRGVRDASRPFLSAEPFAIAAGDAGNAALAQAAPSMELLARTDHHDFITGTSNDMVYATEQAPLLAQLTSAGQSLFSTVAQAIAARIPPKPGATKRVVVFNPSSLGRSELLDLSSLVPGAEVEVDALPPFAWRAIDLPAAPPPGVAPTVQLLDGNGQPAMGAQVMKVVMANAHVRAEFARTAGFALTSLKLDGTETIAAPSFMVQDYADQGGLWRLGNEMLGCSYTALPPPAMELSAETVDGGPDDPAGLAVRVRFTTATATREARLDATSTGLDLALTTGAAAGTTRTARFAFAAGANPALRTSLAGGFADRVPERVYSPTYWPAVEWASAGTTAVLLRQSTGVHFGSDGTMELMAVRNAQQEACDVEGGKGSDGDTHRIEWRIVAAPAPIDAARAAQAFNRPLVAELAGAPAATTDLAAEQSLASVEGDGIVTALKPATRGDGVIVRALLLPGPVTVHLGPLLAGKKATRTDAAERDLEDLGDAGDAITLGRDRFGSIATVRLH